jgi:hypothetical protein
MDKEYFYTNLHLDPFGLGSHFSSVSKARHCAKPSRRNLKIPPLAERIEVGQDLKSFLSITDVKLTINYG